MLVVVVTGRLGMDPEARVTADGKKVTSFSLGTSVGVGDKKETLWFKVSIWGDRFQKLLPYLSKGKQVSVTGTIMRVPGVFTPKNGGDPKVSSIDLSCEMIHLVQGDKKEDAPPSNQTNTKEETYTQDDLPF